MRILADVHNAPRTVSFLRGLGHDVIEVVDRLEPTSTDHAIVSLPGFPTFETRYHVLLINNSNRPA